MCKAMSATSVALVMLILIMISATGVVAWWVREVDKVSKENKLMIVTKHIELSSSLSDLTSKLETEIAELEKSTDKADKDVSETLIKQKAELDTLTTQLIYRLDSLEQYDVTSKESLQKSAELLDAMSQSAQEVIDSFTTFKSEQGKTNQVANSMFDEMDDRVNQVEEQIVGERERINESGEKLNRFNFDDMKGKFSICGVDGNNCRELKFAPVTETFGAGDPVPSGYQLLDKPGPPVHGNRGIMGSFADPSTPEFMYFHSNAQANDRSPYFTLKTPRPVILKLIELWASYHTGKSHENIVSLTIEAWNGSDDTHRTTIASFGNEAKPPSLDKTAGGDELYRTEFDRSLPHTTLSVHGDVPYESFRFQFKLKDDGKPYMSMGAIRLTMHV
jgi:hypothetical protein